MMSLFKFKLKRLLGTEGWQEPVLRIFLLLSTISTALLFLSRGSLFPNYLHNDPGDTFMDYFNVVAFGSAGNPYLNGAGSNYPPLCYIVTKMMHKTVPSGLPSTNDAAIHGGEGFYLRNTEYAMLPYVVLLIVCVLSIAYCTQRMTLHSDGATRFTPVIAVIMSGPFLFLLERGNLILIALSSTFIYLTFRNSEKEMKKNLAYFSIAFAAGLKIYPFIFAFLELREKNWKAFWKITLWTCLLYGTSFLYFGGIEAIKGMLNGLNSFVDSTTNIGFGNQYGVAILFRSVSKIFGINFINPQFKCVFLLVLISGVVSILYAPKKWQAVLAAGMLCVLVPSVSFTYTLVFLLPGLVMAIVDEHHASGFEVVVCCLAFFSILFILTPFISFPGNDPTEVRYPLTWGCFLQNVALVASFCGVVKMSIASLLSKRSPLLCSSDNDV